MGLLDWLTAKVDAAETASTHAIQMYRNGEITKEQALDVSRLYLEADRARASFEADNGEPQGGAGSSTMVNIGGLVVDTASVEYRDWWNANFGERYPLD